MKFDLPKENSNIIKVLGVGGGGSNAVNHMFRQGIDGVDFLVCNTDQQALDVSPVPLKLQLGTTLTEGRGAGSIAEVGKNAAIETMDDIKEIISNNTKMVFITAGMGGGTGTGAAPVIAKAAREMGVLTVGIVTMPFFFEGKKRRQQAEQGIEDIRQNVDTLLIINNEKLREMCGNLPIAQAFAMADDVLTTAAKGIAEIITRTGYINVDFEDVRTVMSDSGVAIMGSASAEGEDRAIKAVEKALSSPLLNDNNIKGARYVLLNIAFGNKEVLMDEISDVTDYIQEEAGASADVIWGYGLDESLGDALSVTIIATGFNQNPNTGVNLERNVEKRKLNLEDATHVEPKKVEEPTSEEAEPFLRKLENDSTENKPAFEKPKENQRVFEFEVTRHALTSDEDTVSEESEVEAVDEDVNEPFMLKQDIQESEESEKEGSGPLHISRGNLDRSDNENSPIEPSPIERSRDERNPIENSPIENSAIERSRDERSRDERSRDERSRDEPKKEWEPFIRSESKPESPKPIVQETPSFKTTIPEPQAKQGIDDRPSREEQSKRAGDRLSRLRELSMKLRTPSGMSDLENEPAFKRKQINLDDVPHSAETNSSRFSLSEEETEDGEKKTKLRPNNPFLHDNVD